MFLHCWYCANKMLILCSFMVLCHISAFNYPPNPHTRTPLFAWEGSYGMLVMSLIFKIKCTKVTTALHGMWCHIKSYFSGNIHNKWKMTIFYITILTIKQGYYTFGSLSLKDNVKVPRCLPSQRITFSFLWNKHYTLEQIVLLKFVILNLHLPYFHVPNSASFL